MLEQKTEKTENKQKKQIFFLKFDFFFKR